MSLPLTRANLLEVLCSTPSTAQEVEVEAEVEPETVPETHKTRRFAKILDKFTRRRKHVEVPTKDCEICFETLSSTSFPQGRLCKGRKKHESSICTACLRTDVRLQMSTKRWADITCQFCPCLLRFRIVTLYVDPDHVMQYKAFLYAYSLQWSKRFQWCTAGDCYYGKIHDTRRLGDTMFCDACGFKTCAYHRVPWHEGQTCQEFDSDVNPFNLTGAALEQYQHEASRGIIKDTSKRCPGCGVRIEKDAGCDYMKYVKHAFYGLQFDLRRPGASLDLERVRWLEGRLREEA